MKKYRTWSEVNLKTLSDNVKNLRAQLGPDTKIMVVVKADAYGHGAVPVGKTALESGASMLGVGDSSEAIELRQSGILDPILILGAVIEEEIGWMVSYNITPTIHSMDLLGLFNEEAKRQNKQFNIHLKMDTGMSRLGSTPKRALEIARKMAAFPNIKLEGACSHLSCSSNHKEKGFTEKQINSFRQAVTDMEAEMKSVIPLKHIANTGAILCNNDASFSMVRAGGIIYGIDPGNLREVSDRFNPILSLKSQIAFLKIVPTGTPVGYGRTFTTKKRTKIATIPIGYNDGYPYHLSNKGYVLINGRKAPVIGSVTMDYIMVDVTDSPQVKTGDEVVLIGRSQDGQNRITVEELAQLSGTSPYVITCGLGKRVKRMYIV
ncbi:MAG: alanine racemase [Planctomycetota bacterium]